MCLEKRDYLQMRSGLVVLIIISGVVLSWIAVGIYWTGYQAKRLTSKQGRAEIKREVSDATTFIVKDKDFHKAINKEFRGTYVLFGLLAVALIAGALGFN